MSETAGIYVMSVPSGHLKIGIAKDPTVRLRSFQTGNPQPIKLEAWFEYPGIHPFDFEQEMHRQLRLFHAHGEWFLAPIELVWRAQKLTVCKLAYPQLYARFMRKKRAAKKLTS